MATNKATEGGGKVKSRQALYSKAAVYAPKAIEVIAKALSSKNEAIALGAAKLILQKTIPDLKAMEVTGDNVRPLIIKLDGNPTISTQTTGSLEGTQEPQL